MVLNQSKQPTHAAEEEGFDPRPRRRPLVGESRTSHDLAQLDMQETRRAFPIDSNDPTSRRRLRRDVGESLTPSGSKRPERPRPGTACSPSPGCAPGSATWDFDRCSSAGDLGGAISNARGNTVGPVLIVFIAVILLAEQFWPAVPRPMLSRAHLVDLSYLVLFAVVVLPLLTLVESGFSTEVSQHAHFLELGRLPLGSQVVVAGLDPRGDRRHELGRARGEPSLAHALALARVAPLARGHERADDLPHAPAHSRLVSALALSRAHPRRERHRARDSRSSSTAASSPFLTPICVGRSVRSGECS